MARKKRRFEQLEAAAAAPTEKAIYVNQFQRQVGERLEDAGQKLEGKGRTILYGVGAAIVLLILIFLFTRWSRGSDAAGQTALGKAIATSTSAISETGVMAGATGKTYKTEKERSEAAIGEFQAVADNFGGDVAEKSKYFIATNRLFVDRGAGIQELEALAGANTPVGKLAKFALAQTRVGDNRLDDGLKMYQDLVALEASLLAKDTLNLEIAKIFEKQGKTSEAADIYFNIAKTASEAKDADGKPIRETQTATDAKEKLKEIDPERAKQIVEPAPETPSGMGGMPINPGQ
ncbi:MAG: hypothetical protein WKF34_10850 [Pyrinomonadaceae bacterium]